MRLSCVTLPFKTRFNGMPGAMNGQCGLEDRQLAMGLETTRGFGGPQHGGCCPAQRYRGIAPVLHVAADAPDRATYSADSDTKRSATVDFDRPSPFAAGTPPPGSRNARPNLRLETSFSIASIAHWPNQSSARAVSQPGSATSAPERSGTRGRATSILPPWKPIFPFVLPQRYAALSGKRSWRWPQRAVCHPPSSAAGWRCRPSVRTAHRPPPARRGARPGVARLRLRTDERAARRCWLW